MKTTVIHHSADFDGLFCREIARKFLPSAELIGWDWGNPKLPFPTDGTVYVMDLSPECFVNPVVEPYDAQRLIWIDHHKSAIEKFNAAIPGYRIDGVAACRLAWQWFTIQQHNAQNATNEALQVPLPGYSDFVERSVSEPLAVRLAGEYDVWDKRDPDAEVWQFALRSRELTPGDWNSMLGTYLPEVPQVALDLMKDGRLLQRYQQRNDANLVNYRSFLVEWEGLKFLTLNTGSFNSLTFAAKDVPETGHDALLGFRWDGKQWSVSLYHARHRTDLDLSAIAKRHGGGGHRGACGFVAKSLPWL